MPTGASTTSSQQDAPRVYLAGGGIASLAAAVYLIRDGGVPGHNVRILEESPLLGGCLDGQGSPETGYVIRGIRMFGETTYTCTYDLLASIPSLDAPGVSLKDEILEFNRHYPTHSRCRLVEGGRRLDDPPLGLDWPDRFALIQLCLESEAELGARRIDEYFAPSFFRSNFWFMWATTFSFQPWHAATELRRYLLRLVHWFPFMSSVERIQHTPLNQHESVVEPIARWLKERDVNFETNTRVVGLDLGTEGGATAVRGIRYTRGGRHGELALGANDLCLVTLGSMTAGSRLGSMSSPPGPAETRPTGSWALWEEIARERPVFGRPATFVGRPDQTGWVSFTATFRDPTFPRLLEAFTGNAPGTGGLVTFKDSNWLLSLDMLRTPHFRNQPDGVSVCWGYGLFPDRPGNHVPKPMADCTGAELLTEACSHLGFARDLSRILRTSTCIPCLMPYVTSQFMPRGPGDRPPVVPPGATNFAFLGQFCEVPEDIAFTMEYSVRSAQTAVYTLLKLDNPVSPLFKGQHDAGILLRALRKLLDQNVAGHAHDQTGGVR